MERAWTRSRNVSKARGNAVKLDYQIDTVLGDILTVLNSNIRGLKESDPASQLKSEPASHRNRIVIP